MRVERTNGAGGVTSSKSVRRSGSDGFTLGEGESATSPTANTGVRSIGGIDILMALQGIEEPGERRRRAVARGRTALDALNSLKIGLLEGGLGHDTVGRLKAAVAVTQGRLRRSDARRRPGGNRTPSRSGDRKDRALPRLTVVCPRSAIRSRPHRREAKSYEQCRSDRRDFEGGRDRARIRHSERQRAAADGGDAQRRHRLRAHRP